MTALEALAILEAAVLECKKRDINTPEVGNALDLLEPRWRGSSTRPTSGLAYVYIIGYGATRADR
jgi:hypothetical protein